MNGKKGALWVVGGVLAVLWPGLQTYSFISGRVERWVDTKVERQAEQLRADFNARLQEIEMQICADHRGHWFRGECRKP